MSRHTLPSLVHLWALRHLQRVSLRHAAPLALVVVVSCASPVPASRSPATPVPPQGTSTALAPMTTNPGSNATATPSPSPLATQSSTPPTDPPTTAPSFSSDPALPTLGGGNGTPLDLVVSVGGIVVGTVPTALGLIHPTQPLPPLPWIV